MAQNQSSYDNEYKVQAVKLAQEIGGHKAADELGIPSGTIYAWVKAFIEGRLVANSASHTPNHALSLNEDLIELRKRVKEQEKEIRRLKEENEFLGEAGAFFAASRRKSAKKQGLILIAIKTEDGMIKGKISFYCRMLDVPRQAFSNYLKTKDHPWKYQPLADAMLSICKEDECNDTYGRIRMYQASRLRQPEGVPVPSERTVYRVMEEIGSDHRPRRKPGGITKADKEARKSGDLLKRDFTSEKPLEKCVTDITELKASDGKLYVSAIFDCYDLAVLGLAMDTTMKATLCEQTLANAYKTYPLLRGAILHSDRGTQYTSGLYLRAINNYGIRQNMNSAGGRCHDNARCESMWAGFKEELLYGRYDSTTMTVEQLKTLVWRYFISYWNNRRICSANEGLPPLIKRRQYYASL